MDAINTRIEGKLHEAAVIHPNRVEREQRNRTPEALPRVKNDKGQVYTNLQATSENVDRVTAAINRIEHFKTSTLDTRFRYQVDEDSGNIRIQLVHYKTGDVIEEIPSKKLVEFANSLQEFAGLALETKA